jgi:hypothetical protein
MCAVFALPGGYLAATERTDPYREIAQSIITQVEADPGSRYAVYETVFCRRKSFLDYYMRRFSPRLRVDGLIFFCAEKKGIDQLARLETELAGQDMLVIAFPHLRMRHFPRLMNRLGDNYDVVVSQLTERGLGFVVLKRRTSKVPP